MRIGLSQQRIAKTLNSMKNDGLNPIFLDELQQNALGFQSLTTQYGVPIQFQLAKSFTEVDLLVSEFIDNDQEYFIELKYDGERLQIHYNDGEIQLFGRSMECKTERYPIFVENLKNHFDQFQIQSAIFDCELICYDEKNGILPFQEMQSQKITSEGICAVCFDILMLNYKSLSLQSLGERQIQYKKLMNSISEHPATISYLNSVRLEKNNQHEIIQQMFDSSLKQGLEGVMIKRDNHYRPASRTEWAKLKIEKELDLLLIGAYWGSGKRSKVFGSFLLGARQGETILPLTKLGTGFSEVELQELTQSLEPVSEIVKPLDITASKAVKPDVWFSGSRVWEVSYDTITESPRYWMENMNFKGGLSLRFPRFKRARDDKNKFQIATIDEVLKY